MEHLCESHTYILRFEKVVAWPCPKGTVWIMYSTKTPTTSEHYSDVQPISESTSHNLLYT